MAHFKYSALGAHGSVISGELQASDRTEAFALLSKQRLQPFALDLAGGDAAQKNSSIATNATVRLNLAQIVLFTEELGDLLAGGLQLEPALAAMERRRELSGIRTLAAALRAKIRDGMSFSKAVQSTSPGFGALFSALAAAGEASGALPAILKRQAMYLRSLQALRSKVLFALVYPCFLIASAVVVTLLFAVYLIPKLMELLDSTGGTLPLGAVVVLKLGDFIKAAWWIFLLLGAAAWVLLRAWLATPASKIPWSRFRLRLPLFGAVLKARFHVQFLETMSNLAASGLPMIQALQLTQQAAGNAFLQQEMLGVIQTVGDGLPLSRALERSGHFPPLLIDMVAVGEQTGDFAGAFSRAAERFDRDLTRRVEKFSAFIQPTVVCLMAAMVGIMAWLMITTIFQTISTLGNR